MDKEIAINDSNRKLNASQIIGIVCIGIVIFTIILSVALYCISKFPSDCIRYYPNTHWRCEELELDFYVDAKGNVTGYFDDAVLSEEYEVYTASSTKGTSNEIIIILNSKYWDEKINLECFFQRVDKGVIYLVVHKWDASVFDLDKEVVIEKYVFPEYKLILVDE